MHKFRYGLNPDYLIHYRKVVLTITPLESQCTLFLASKIKWLFESILKYYRHFKSFKGLRFYMLPWTPTAKGNSISQNVWLHYSQMSFPTSKRGHWKNRSYIQILDTALLCMYHNRFVDLVVAILDILVILYLDVQNDYHANFTILLRWWHCSTRSIVVFY